MNVEHLTLTGASAIDGTGNGLANIIIGNGAANTLNGGDGDDQLNGGGGIDTLIGGIGNDTYTVDNTADVVVESAGGGTDTAFASASYTLSAHVEHLTLTGASAIDGTGNGLANIITGNGAANTLNGGDGDDQLNGGAGIDTLIGGIGNDVYTVDNTADVVVESAGGGTDTVLASVSYTLSAEIERLTLTGSAANGTGNGLANIIIGNAAANVLNGGAGADFLRGLGGADTYHVDDAGDVVDESFTGSSGIDTVFASISVNLGDSAVFKGDVENVTLVTGIAGLSATGNGLANTLTGNNLGNTLNGGLGADLMRGLGGFDIYHVDDAGDVVDETVAGSNGTDTVMASISVNLGDTTRFKGDIERVTLVAGIAGLTASGNGLANTLVGNELANTLNGGAGADSMTGGLGHDTYYVDNAGDVVVEGANGGTDTVIASASYTLSAEVERLTLTGSAANGTGNGLANTIVGNGVANVLNGGAGADFLRGLGGSDTYHVDDAGDVVDEAFAGSSGTDTVIARVSVNLGNSALFKGDIENVTLADGIAGLNVTGNALDNLLVGSNFGNTLNGGAGADIMRGMNGFDIYVVDNLGDVVDESVVGSGGTDTVQASVSVDLTDTTRFKGDIERIILQQGFAGLNATGNALANQITGNAFGNTINGGAGADLMRGLGGFDIYYVDNVGDVVDEAFAGSGGTDTVLASVSVNLGDATRFMGDIERVTLLDGIAGLNATGNALDNLLIGNNLGNTLNGGAGADILRGMNGFDIYVVDNLGDVVDESVAGSGGTDTVQASVSVDLGDANRFKGDIERITLVQGIAGLNATGNALANIITGSAFGNFINGKGGNDTLTGGAGTDRFVFDTALNAATNVDTITDFSVPDDAIQLDDAIFTLLGAPGGLAAALFKNTASGAVDADDRIVYNHLTGSLSYDTNGSGAGGDTSFANLATGLAMTHLDFTVI